MHEIAQSKVITHPIGVSTVINDFYVDDILAITEKEAIKVRNQIIEVLQQEEFQFRK